MALIHLCACCSCQEAGSGWMATYLWLNSHFVMWERCNASTQVSVEPVEEFIIVTASKIEMGYLSGVSHVENAHTNTHRWLRCCCYYYYYNFFDRYPELQIFSSSPLVIRCHRRRSNVYYFPAARALAAAAARWIIYEWDSAGFQTGSRSAAILKSSKPNSPKWFRQTKDTMIHDGNTEAMWGNGEEEWWRDEGLD